MTSYKELQSQIEKLQKEAELARKKMSWLMRLQIFTQK